jgi:DNA-binding response OmpR family regulator
MTKWLDLIGRGSGPLQALIVEDQSLIAEDLAALVQETGAVVVGIAAGATDALLLAAEHRPDVALVDIMLLDGHDGIQVANDIREMVDASIIFCTGSGDPVTRKRICAFGRAQLLLKPYDLHDVTRAMLRVCQDMAAAGTRNASRYEH